MTWDVTVEAKLTCSNSHFAHVNSVADNGRMWGLEVAFERLWEEAEERRWPPEWEWQEDAVPGAPRPLWAGRLYPGVLDLSWTAALMTPQPPGFQDCSKWVLF